MDSHGCTCNELAGGFGKNDAERDRGYGGGTGVESAVWIRVGMVWLRLTELHTHIPLM